MSESNFGSSEVRSRFINFSSKRKRAYRNMLFGLQKSHFLSGVSVRFMTLTTSDLMCDSSDYHFCDLSEHWRVLKARIRRLRPIDLERQGYMSHSAIVFYYGHKNLFKRFPFEYFKVITNEGNGVVHVMFRGWYIPYNWLVDNWSDIHLSWEVNIQLVSNLSKDDKKVVSYIVSQYVVTQSSSYVRFSQSVDWVFRGFVVAWRELNADVWRFERSVGIPDFRGRPIYPWDLIYKRWSELLYGVCFHQVSLDVFI
jgi:hypothetical protein